MTCDATHESGLMCRCEGFHPQHIAGFGASMVFWPNEAAASRLDDLADPRPKTSITRSARAKVHTMAKRAGPEVRVGAPSVAQAALRAEVGIEMAQRTAGERWRDDAISFIMEYARTHSEVFCDDLWAAGLPSSESDRALGSVMRQLSRMGVLVNSGEQRTSVRSNNSSAKVVWRSMVYAADPAL